MYLLISGGGADGAEGIFTGSKFELFKCVSVHIISCDLIEMA